MSKTSQEILPFNQRLGRNQILELEGNRVIGGISYFIQPVPALLIKYHEALIRAEAVIKILVKGECSHCETLKERIEEITEEKEYAENRLEDLKIALDDVKTYLPPYFIKEHLYDL